VYAWPRPRFVSLAVNGKYQRPGIGFTKNGWNIPSTAAPIDYASSSLDIRV